MLHLYGTGTKENYTHRKNPGQKYTVKLKVESQPILLANSRFEMPMTPVRKVFGLATELWPVLRILDMYRMPVPGSEFCHLGSRIRVKKRSRIPRIFNPKIVFKLSPDPGSGFISIPDRGAKKSPKSTGSRIRICNTGPDWCKSKRNKLLPSPDLWVDFSPTAPRPTPRHTSRWWHPPPPS